MYYNDYDDYMRNILGYSSVNDGTYQRYNDNCCSCSNANYGNADYNSMNYYNNVLYGNMGMNQFKDRGDWTNVENMYPEVYRVINPVVCKVCDNNTQPISEYLVEQMTDNVYDNVVNRFEVQNVINLNIETREADADSSNNVEQCCNNRSTNTTSSNRSSSGSTTTAVNNNSEKTVASKVANNVITEVEKENRSSQSQPRRRNRLLRDLIRILILDRLFKHNRPNRPPYRPPFRPGLGPRPGMPGNGPQMPRMDDNYGANTFNY